MRGISNLGSLASLIGINTLSLIPIRPAAFTPIRTARPIYRGHHVNRTTYFAAGLNGKRAVARRLRQIQAGSLRVENGLLDRTSASSEVEA